MKLENIIFGFQFNLNLRQSCATLLSQKRIVYHRNLNFRIISKAQKHSFIEKNEKIEGEIENVREYIRSADALSKIFPLQCERCLIRIHNSFDTNLMETELLSSSVDSTFTSNGMNCMKTLKVRPHFCKYYYFQKRSSTVHT